MNLFGCRWVCILAVALISVTELDYCVSEQLRQGSVSNLDIQRLVQRLDALEAENVKLRSQLELNNAELSETGTPSFHHERGENKEAQETVFMETGQQGQAKVVQQEDPTIECQTVCKFVRPNAPSQVNDGQDAEKALLQQIGINAAVDSSE